jgi:trimeric autotransporter adhesin
MNALIQLNKMTLPLSLTLACFTLLPRALAVNPPPGGGYPRSNTAVGDNALQNLTTGSGNTAIGFQTLFSNTTGGNNTADGNTALISNITGSNNTAIGTTALASNTTANNNTAIGNSALGFNTTGQNNTANGSSALLINTTGCNNTAIGTLSLANNTTGTRNTASGFEALYKNTGDNNTANGAEALHDNTTGDANTANGAFALANNTGGSQNTATGVQALLRNKTGIGNTANGVFALQDNTGSFNTAIGWDALGNNTNGAANTAVGYGALEMNTTGRINTALGNFAGRDVTTANQVICIGSFGANVSNSTWIGHIYGVVPQSGTTAPVVVSEGGQLGTVASSERFKKDIATMEKASEAILSMRPVTFHYKNDTKGTPQFGLIAEEVAKVNPALVLPDQEGKPYTVRYDAVNAMLLNEFLKEHRRNKKQEATIADLKAEVAILSETVKEQAAQIQKVNAFLEIGKRAPQLAENN